MHTGKTSQRRRLSVSSELFELEGAVLAARLAADVLRFQSWNDQTDAEAVPWALSSILSLLGSRIRDLNRGIRGEIDPKLLIAHHNVVNDDEQLHDQDLILEPWDSTATTQTTGGRSKKR